MSFNLYLCLWQLILFQYIFDELALLSDSKESLKHLLVEAIIVNPFHCFDYNIYVLFEAIRSVHLIDFDVNILQWVYSCLHKMPKLFLYLNFIVICSQRGWRRTSWQWYALIPIPVLFYLSFWNWSDFVVNILPYNFWVCQPTILNFFLIFALFCWVWFALLWKSQMHLIFFHGYRLKELNDKDLNPEPF